MSKGAEKITIAVNRKAIHEYEIIETFEAGLCLKGAEVKSLRNGQANITSSFARVENDGIYLYAMQIPHYKFNTISKIDPLRVRKLLLNKNEIKKITARTKEKGFALIPVELYFKKGWAKISIAIARGRKNFDKRERIKERDIERDIRRETKNRY